MIRAVLDTNVIFAAINVGDPQHARCRAVLGRADLSLVVPLLCVAEVSHLVNRDLTPEIEAGFVRSLTVMNVEAPEVDDWTRIADLVQQYADFPLGAVDASIVALSERLNARIILTMDHRHFRAIRPKHVEAFTLLPQL